VCVNIKFHENLSSGSGAVPCGQMDRHDKAKLSLCAILRTCPKIHIHQLLLCLGGNPQMSSFIAEVWGKGW